jgi:hypothetical protein
MSVISSAYTSPVQINIANNNLWSFVAPNDPTVKVTGVTVRVPLQSKVTEQLGVFRPLGRSKAVVVATGIFGTDGTYVFTTQGDTQWNNLLPLVNYQGSFFVTDPLGRSKYVRFVERSYTELGPLDNLRRELTVNYLEVDNPE